MAIKTVQVIEDDFDGTPANTRSFGFDGVTYEIDLNDEHFQELNDALAPYLDKARRARGGNTGRRASSSPLRGRTQSTTDRGVKASAVRDWANANGVEVNERGRVPDSIVEQYEAAQKKPKAAPAPAKKAAKKAPAKKAVARKAPAKKAAAPAPEPELASAGAAAES